MVKKGQENGSKKGDNVRNRKTKFKAAILTTLPSIILRLAPWPSIHHSLYFSFLLILIPRFKAGTRKFRVSLLRITFQRWAKNKMDKKEKDTATSHRFYTHSLRMGPKSMLLRLFLSPLAPMLET